jgi:tetratricopeptide (TPR) repeat protein
VRQYAQERLRESGAAAAVRERHRDHFLALVTESESQVVGAAQAQWLRRLEEEHDNLRAAMEWCATAQRYTEGLTLCAALQRHLTGGHIAEGRDWCARMLDKAGRDAPPQLRAKVLAVAGTLADAHGDWTAARTQHEQALAIKRELGDRMGIAISLNGLGSVAYSEGDLALAESRFAECLAILQELGNLRLVATALSNLGSVANQRADVDGARARFEESLAITREQKDLQGTALALFNLGVVNCEAGDYRAAAVQLRESLLIRQEQGDQLGIAYSLEGLAKLLAATGEAPRAVRIWAAAEQLREVIGSPRSPDYHAECDRRVASVRSSLGDGAAFDHAWQEGLALPLERAIAIALEKSGSQP